MRRLPALLALAALAGPVLAPGTATAAVPPETRFSATTGVGVHNAYERGTYPYLAQALDARPGLIELDVWPDVLTRQWRVSHSNPLGNDNNCVAATSAAQLYTGTRNRSLEHCLDDIRLWLGAHPDAGPLVLKLELKTGFSGRTGQGPAQLDAVLAARLGDRVFRPAACLARDGGTRCRATR
ncbi:hypothetical protein GCM10027452_42350 [Micromonospora halotolerans]